MNEAQEPVTPPPPCAACRGLGAGPADGFVCLVCAGLGSVADKADLARLLGVDPSTAAERAEWAALMGDAS